MTCAHVVHVALKKLPGVNTVDVSLNKGLATVKLNAGNSLTVQQFWHAIQQNGYTPKNTVISARGQLANLGGRLQLHIAGTSEVLTLTSDPGNPAAYQAAESRSGQTVILHGTLQPSKDLKSQVPLQVNRLE